MFRETHPQFFRGDDLALRDFPSRVESGLGPPRTQQREISSRPLSTRVLPTGAEHGQGHGAAISRLRRSSSPEGISAWRS